MRERGIDLTAKNRRCSITFFFVNALFSPDFLSLSLPPSLSLSLPRSLHFFFTRLYCSAHGAGCMVATTRSVHSRQNYIMINLN